MARAFYAAVFYNDETGEFMLENWADAAGRDDGDIYDDEADDEPWRFAGETGVEGEVELDALVWETMKKAIDAIPKLIVGKTGNPNEEPDLIY